ncbi:MAG: ABC transporter ATP-binding protein [Chlamydiota bacterium]
MKPPIIKVENLYVQYRNYFAVKDIHLTINQGETVGLVGESGCGKSTVGKAILGLTPVSSGSIYFGDHLLNGNHRTKFQDKMQLIFQDPYSALNPRMTIEQILIEPLIIQKKYSKHRLKEKAKELIDLVNIPQEYLKKGPDELSGGQRQRINIARAISLNPAFIFCDEPVSSLDSIHQREIVQLMESLQKDQAVSYLFVSHDLPLVCSTSHQIAVMYFGEIVEWRNGKSIQKKPLHPYTKTLFSSVPIPNPKIERKRKKILIQGEVPSIMNPPSGCPFHTRCPNAKAICSEKAPPKHNVGNGEWVKCHFPGY